jgi:hypothetical protein
LFFLAALSEEEERSQQSAARHAVIANPAGSDLGA